MSIFTSIINKNKDYIIYNFSNIYEVAFGKTQKGNDLILDLYSDKKDKCNWYHLLYDTSAHLIIHNRYSELSQNDELKILLHFYKPDKLKLKNKLPIVMKSKLIDVEKTKILGKVKCNTYTQINI
jgi:hypothetical protein